MPEFKSPLGNKQIQGQPMRDFSVPDETGYEPPTSPQRPVRPHRHQHEAPVFDERSMREFQSEMQAHPQIQAPVREMSELEMQVLAEKKAKREGKQRLSEGARRRIEILVGMASATRTCDVEGTAFTLRTLTNKESRDILVASIPYDGTIEFTFENAKQTLARSLIQIAGTDIDQFLSSPLLEDRLAFVEELPQALFTRLFNEYATLDADARNKFSIKTDKEVKEVVEDLKK